MRILGISAFYYNSAACLVEDGDLVAAAQEERFTRKKHDYLAFYDKPLLKFNRRVIGRDPLHRKLDRSAESYWDPHVARKDKASYFKQF